MYNALYGWTEGHELLKLNVVMCENVFSTGKLSVDGGFHFPSTYMYTYISIYIYWCDE